MTSITQITDEIIKEIEESKRAYERRKGKMTQDVWQIATEYKKAEAKGLLMGLELMRNAYNDESLGVWFSEQKIYEIIQNINKLKEVLNKLS